MSHFSKGDPEKQSLLAFIDKHSQFGFRCQSINMFDDYEEGEDRTIIVVILFVC